MLGRHLQPARAPPASSPHRRNLARGRARAARRPGRPARQVLRLTRTASGTAALLAAGTGPAASLVAAWSADAAATGPCRPPLPLHGATPTSASFGPGGTAAIMLTGEPRRDRRGPRSLMAAAARTATGHRHAGPRPRRQTQRAGRPPQHDHRLAAPAGVSRVGQGTGHQRPRPVRLLKLRSLARVRLAEYGDRGKGAPRPGTRQADRAMPSGLRPDRPASQRVKIQRAGRDLAGRLLPLLTADEHIRASSVHSPVHRTSDIDTGRLSPHAARPSADLAPSSHAWFTPPWSPGILPADPRGPTGRALSVRTKNTISQIPPNTATAPIRSVG